MRGCRLPAKVIFSFKNQLPREVSSWFISIAREYPQQGSSTFPYIPEVAVSSHQSPTKEINRPKNLFTTCKGKELLNKIHLFKHVNRYICRIMFNCNLPRQVIQMGTINISNCLCKTSHTLIMYDIL